MVKYTGRIVALTAVALLATTAISSAQTMEKSKSLGELAEQTREKGQQGLEAVEQSVQGMKSVREKVQLIAQTILDLRCPYGKAA